MPVLDETSPVPRTGRANSETRPLVVERGVNRYAEGSALVKLGFTEVLVTVTVEDKVPNHVRERKAPNGKKLPPTGWLMAEYSLLPRATHERTQRERARTGGRTMEIQRLLGRALRTVVDLDLFRNRTVIVDADVLQADGGTRVASVLGGYAALFDLADRQTRAGRLDDWPLRHEVGAVSVGLVDGEPRLDLDYAEDSRASADFNVIATAEGHLLEVQGGAEGEPVNQNAFLDLLALGLDGVAQLIRQMKAQL
ncbi:MAG TPA: ribonuclease PH [Deinococcales bacterium]|nr:ribonuclease PH [Deinococcales bacterium]